MIDGGYASQVTAKPPRDFNPNAFIGPLVEAESRMSDVMNRIGRITDQLCGPVPEQALQGQVRSIPNGLFETASAHGQSISEMLDRVNSMLSRIERSLP